MSIFVPEWIKKIRGGPGDILLSEMSEGKDKYQNISLYPWNLKADYEHTNKQ